MSPTKRLASVLLSAGATVTAIFLHAREYGRELALSPDSVSYLSAARHVAAGEGLVRFDGEPLLYWPPLYSWSLALLEWVGMDALANGAWLQWLAFGATAVLAGLWVGERTGSLWRTLLVTLAVLASKPLWHVSVFLWSEPLFNLFVLVSAYAVDRLRRRNDGWSLILLVVASAAACLTRYAGIFVIVSAAIAILVPGWATARERVRACLLYVAGAVLPIAVWWARNTSLTGDWTGGRVPGGFDAILGFETFARTIADWVLPWSWSLALKGPLALLLLLLIALAARRALRSRVEGRDGILACASFLLVYSVGILGLGFVTVFNFPDHRILSPLFAPLVVLTGLSWPALRPASGRALVRTLLLATAALAVLVWIGRSTIVARRWVWIQLRQEVSLASPRWKDSALAAAVAASAKDGPLYSNMPHVIYLYGGRDCFRTPRRHFFGAEERETRDLEMFEARLRESRTARLAWFELPAGSYFYRPEEFPSSVALTLEQRYDDGALYRMDTVTPAAPPPSPDPPRSGATPR